MPKKKTMVVMLIVLTLSLGAIACQKLETSWYARPVGTPLPPKVLKAIPLDYGELVAVIPYAEDAHWAVLWFQKPNKTITVVYVNMAREIVWVRATIPRD
jgi:hypothetical protein